MNTMGLTNHQQSVIKYQKSEKGKIANRRAQKKFSSTAHGKLSRRISMARYRRRNPEIVAARTAVSRVIRAGKLPPAADFNCHFCSKQAEQYHHADYKRLLDVIPVCRTCHTILTDLAKTIKARRIASMSVNTSGFLSN